MARIERACWWVQYNGYVLSCLHESRANGGFRVVKLITSYAKNGPDMIITYGL